MRLSLQATIVAAAVFAVICLSVAFTGFASLGGLTDPGAIADAKGFAWFWSFLGGVAILVGLVAWRMTPRSEESEDA